MSERATSAALSDEGLDAPGFQPYGSTHMPYEFVLPQLPQTLRLLSWITRSVGNDHPAYDDVEMLAQSLAIETFYRQRGFLSEGLVGQLMDSLKDGMSACSSVAISKDRKLVRDGSVLYAQTEDWCKWLSVEVGAKIRAAGDALEDSRSGLRAHVEHTLQESRRLDWVLRHMSDAERVRLGISHDSTCTRSDLDVAMAKHTASGGMGADAMPAQGV